MKVFAVAAALLASVASVASAEDCDVAVLAPLLEETYVAQCSEDTGFTFVPPSIPSDEVVAKVCTSEACKQTLEKIESFGLGDCLLLDTLLLETDLLGPIAATCGFATGSGSTGSADVGSDVTAPSESSDASTDEVDHTADSAPSETEVSSGSSSEAAATPTPTPDNAAAHQTAAVAAAAVVTVAVAAAL